MSTRLFLAAALALGAVAPAAGAQQRPPARVATLVLTNGKVVTVDSTKPEAQAVAVAGDRILAVGSSAEIRRWVGPGTKVIDLQGALVVPGLIEGHGHYMGLGDMKLQLDLTKARSWDEIVAMVGDAAKKAKPGEWIRGRGFHQEKWDRRPEPSVEGNPVHATLSAASPNNPVYLTHASGHAAFVNAKALELAGITKDTKNPDGGEIVRDAEGNATGLLRETAQGLGRRARTREEGRMSRADRAALERRLVALAGEEALSKGITSFHDAGTDFRTIDLYKRLAAEGKLPVRIYAMVRGEPYDSMAKKLARYRTPGFASHYVVVRSIKRQIDGALGSHGAWLLEPYDDLPRSTGLVLDPVDSVARVADLAIRTGYQVNTHAIGDRANREVLDIYERTFARYPQRRDLRWRIEHAQHIDPADIPRFGQLDVIASMQGIHATSDLPWVPAKLGEKRMREDAYMWQTLWKTGAVITNGTDVPVEDIDPIASFYATVSRRVKDGSVVMPEQRLSREQALRTYTINNAYASFEERLKGSITPGKLADITILSKDILTIPEEEIPTTRVLYTIVGGKVKYQAPKLSATR